MKYVFTWKEQFKYFLISIFIALMIYDLISISLDKLSYSILNITAGNTAIISYYSFLFLSLIIITVFHELIHAAFYRFYGGKIKFGFKKYCPYTQEISNIAIDSYKFLVILFAPAVIISIVSLFIPHIGPLFLCLNLIGCSGDFYMGYLVLKFNDNCKIVDKSYGFDVIN